MFSVTSTFTGMLCQSCADTFINVIDSSGERVARALFMPKNHDLNGNLSVIARQSECYVCHRIASLVSPIRPISGIIQGNKESLEAAFYNYDCGLREGFTVANVTSNAENTFATSHQLHNIATSIPASCLTFDAAKRIKSDWIENCILNHVECPAARIVNNDDRPKRLIRIAMSSTQTVSKAELISTAGLSGDLQYVTVSHAWGAKEFVTLEESNHREFEQGLPLDRPGFNKTFTEAMTMAGLLGYTYIWIDSLCIKQDSIKDWEQEIPRMGAIYKNSDLTLSATGFGHGLHGMQSKSRRTLLPPRIKTKQNEEWLVISDSELYFDTPLQKRGWILQESLLSPRTLHFTSKGLIWECCSSVANEVWHDGMPPPSKLDGGPLYHGSRAAGYPGPLFNWSERKTLFTSDDVDTNIMKSEQNQVTIKPYTNDATELSKTSYIEQWYKVVAPDYVVRHLTKESDRFPALQGLANHVHMLTGSRYLAGHFEHQILRSLLWSPYFRRTEVTPSFMPSWSWVSLRGPSKELGPTDMLKPGDCFEPCAEYLEARQVPRKRENIGQVSEKDWRLHIRGCLVKIGGETDLVLKSERTANNMDDYDFQYTAVLPIRQGESSDSVDLEYGANTKERKLVIKVLPDHPSQLRSRLLQGPDSNVAGWHNRKSFDDTSVFLFPLGASSSFHMTPQWKVRGLLVEVVDKSGCICRRLGTFKSETLRSNMTHEELLAGLFGGIKQCVLILE